MALITANVALEITDVDFTGDWLDPTNTIALTHNFTSAPGALLPGRAARELQ